MAVPLNLSPDTSASLLRRNYPSSAETAGTTRLLHRIAVQKPADDRTRWFIIPAHQIAYLFLGCAAAVGAINASWVRRERLENGHVYVRTSRGHTLRTDFPQFSNIEERLDPAMFLVINRTLLANLERIVEVDLNGKTKQVGLAVGGEIEWLTVSRRALDRLLPSLGFRSRGTGI